MAILIPFQFIPIQLQTKYKINACRDIHCSIGLSVGPGKYW